MEEHFLEAPLQEQPDNIEVEHLTASADNRRLIQEILTSNEDMLQYYNSLAIYYQGFGGTHPLQSKIKLKKSTTSKPDLYLDKNNLTLVTSPFV